MAKRKQKAVEHIERPIKGERVEIERDLIFKKSAESMIEQIIFGSRWLQAPLFLGLIVASAVYAYKFLIELIHLVGAADAMTEEMVMLSVLTLVDITMVANLLAMVIIGGYATFVSKLDLHGHTDRPEWLDKIDAGSLKVKLAGSLVGVSGIHLLKAFINVDARPPQSIMWQVIIHAVFLFSALMLAWTEKIMHSKH